MEPAGEAILLRAVQPPAGLTLGWGAAKSFGQVCNLLLQFVEGTGNVFSFLGNPGGHAFDGVREHTHG